ncbi:MAG: hypothetical protein AUREO_056830 [Aureobasidium pullulans]|nr:MAG: hypothetical protein AUREO_056830 [Aureobasidium pullulans]
MGSSSDSEWETDDSEPRTSTSRNNTRRTNAPGQRNLPPFDIRDMSPFGDSALGDFMYGMEANGFGSMLRNNGVPPMGFDPRDFFGSDNYYENSTDDDEFPNEQGSSGDGGSSEHNRPPAIEVPADNDDSDDDSSSGDSEEEEYWAIYRAEEQKMKLRKQQAKEGTQKHSSIGPSDTSASGSAPKETKQTESASTPIASTAEEKSTQARNRGNDLYRKGLFDDATKAYFEALSLTPNDPAPLSNLSAVQFELGNYSGSEVYAEKALKLLEDEEDTNVKKQKLFVRLAKAKILTSKDAALVATKVDSSVEKDKILKSMAMNIASKKSSSWSKILDELEAEGEYYAVGHDPPNPELDSKMISSKGDLSWMFAGIGDARNFFATLIHLDKAEHDKKTNRKFHFSLLDLKAAAMAKVLVLLHLLNQIGDRGALTCLAYVFGSIVMPAFAYDKLQQTVTALVDKLQAGSPVADWIYISEAQRAPLLRQLRSWQQHLDGKYDTATFRQHGLLQASQGKMGRYSTHGAEDHVPPFCERDDVIFWTYGIVMPQGELAAKHEKQLLQLIEGQKLSPRGPPLPDRKITDYIDRNWKPNVTLVDIDYSKDPPDFTFNPPELAYVMFACQEFLLFCPDEQHAKIFGLSNLLEYFELFFRSTMLALKELRSRLCVEIVVGEMNDCLERIHHDTWSTRGQKQGKFDPQQFPKLYNRVHMSNIPDYVGGALSTFLFGVPLLQREKSSALNSCVLLNTPAFNNHEDYLAEYTLLTGLNRVERYFGVELRKDSSSLNGWGRPGVVLHDYTMWTVRSQGPPKKLPANERMSRAAVEKYLQAHLLKICLPYPRPKLSAHQTLRAPLNLTVLFRLISHLQSLGYPAHWFSDILGQMLQGTVLTTARAPRQLVTTVGAAKKLYSSMNISVKPWLAELTTLSSIWRGLLPFGLLCEDGLVPDIGRVSKYSLKFPTPSDDMLNRPHFTVVFWNTSLGAVPTSLRWLLLDDEEGDRSRKAIKIREEGIHILTTFQWSSDTTTASFWLQSDVVMAMQKGDWKAYIWRLDTWQPVTSGVSVRDHIRKLANWNGENISDKNDEEELPIRSASKASTKTANMSSSTQETTPTPIVQDKQTPTIPAHISNDVDRKLVREFQITLMRLVAAADEDVKKPGLPKSVKRVRQAYVRAIAEYRKRTDPSFTPAKPTKFENWPLGELINEVREVECMLLGAPLLPADLKCQMHVAKLVAGTMPSAEVPSKESLSFLEKFDQHIETRKRYDAWKEKQSKQPQEPRQVNPDCAPQ